MTLPKPWHCALALAALALGGTTLAQESEAAASGSSEDTALSATTSYWNDHFSLHGYLTLAYADAELTVGPELLTGDEVMLGIEGDGTFPYGNAAVNLRFDPSPRHSFTLQLAAAELGTSPADDFQGKLELDWFFYQAELTDHTWLRLGRHPVPAGLFNEIRDVGVILPFFRPAYVFYREGALLSETVDGVALTQELFVDQPWGAEATVYYGEFDVLQQGLGFLNTVLEEEADNAVGAQLWISSPIEGLRLGVGGSQWDINAVNPLISSDESEWKAWHASAEYLTGRWTLRGEYRRVKTDFLLDGSHLLSANGHNYYLQVGARISQRLSVYVQPEASETQQSGPLFLDPPEKSRDRQDIGFSVVFEATPNLVFKVEYHDVESEISVATEIV
ncbi:MAG: hypothetical protein SX243_17140, partial [Acidobacteriota bacterium]|nr:hypothetical protein [Acidobacteriota bacterium]